VNPRSPGVSLRSTPGYQLGPLWGHHPETTWGAANGESVLDILESEVTFVESEPDIVECRHEIDEITLEIEEIKGHLGEMRPDLDEIKLDLGEMRGDLERTGGNSIPLRLDSPARELDREETRDARKWDSDHNSAIPWPEAVQIDALVK
jgi:hypothetical protein